MCSRKILCIALLFVDLVIFPQETGDNNNINDSHHDFGTAGGITLYGERQEEFDSESTEVYVLNQLNGTVSDRKRFIETGLLERAGFRRTANVKYRKTNASEKTFSVLHGAVRAFSLGLAPVSHKPFLEIEYDKLPKGEYYRFESVIVKSDLLNLTPEVLILIELEYMLQIEFFNGIVMQDTLKYYTNENISKFEKLILRLPDVSESIKLLKKRYMNELKKIRTAFERYNNPGEDYLRALQNLKF
jgi:hypothetical protein